MSEIIELKIKVERKMFYNSQSSWGVFAVTPLTNKNKVKLNKYFNFVINGSMPELFEEQEYDVKITPSNHPKYGDGYSMVEVGFKKPTSVSEQQDYIKIMLPESQYKAIIKKYPNHLILDMMKDGTFDYSGVKGIGKKRYENIRRKLLSNLDAQEALLELKDLDISFQSMKRLIDHFGSANVVVQKVRENIYSLCEVKYFGFLKVDEYALNRGDDPESKNRIVAAIEYELGQEESNGHSWVSVNLLKDKLIELLKIDVSIIEAVLGDLNEEEFYTDGLRVALYRNYFYEKEIKNKLIQLNNAKSNIYIKDIDKQISKVEEENEITYADEQRRAIKLACENNVLILNGKGGVGKSFTVNGILKTLEGYSHACCALSGKASQILGQLGLNAYTIHRLLGFDPMGGFIHNADDPLSEDIIILDEGSMCNSYLIYKLLDAIPLGSKVIIVGDSGQLPAIGNAAVFSDLLKANKLPQIELKTVHRQAAKSGILSVANEIRDGKQIIGSNDFNKKVFGELKDFVLFPMEDKHDIKDMTLAICKTFLNKNPDDFQVITALKNRGDLSVTVLNKEIQGIFNDISKPFIKRGGYEYRVGDRIIQSGNNYGVGIDEDIDVFNGTIGKVVNIDTKKGEEKLHIQFDGIDEIICYEKEHLDQIELAYAISCHRSQGSTIPYTLFVFDYSAYKLLNRQFIYTGITRSSKGCVTLCEARALRHAIRNDDSGKRNTFLFDMLMEGE